MKNNKFNWILDMIIIGGIGLLFALILPRVMYTDDTSAASDCICEEQAKQNKIENFVIFQVNDECFGMPRGEFYKKVVEMYGMKNLTEYSNNK